MGRIERLLRGGPDAALDLRDPGARWRAHLHYALIDHARLRQRWTNLAEVAPGVWRSNQPTHARFVALKARGLRAVLNLRGANDRPCYLFEKESCEALDLALISVRLNARAAPPVAMLLQLFEAFRTLERPFLFHCKSGANRSGLASALYLLAHEGAKVAQARRHLSLSYLHLCRSSAGVLGNVLDHYERRLERGPMGVEDWVRGEYHPGAVQAGFRR